MPVPKLLQSASRTNEKEAAAKKGLVEPSKLVLRERRSKASTDSNSDAANAESRTGCNFTSRPMLPAKTSSSAMSRPTTAGLAPSGKAAVKRKVDAIVARVRARLTKEDKEKEKEPAPEVDAEVTGYALWADP